MAYVLRSRLKRGIQKIAFSRFGTQLVPAVSSAAQRWLGFARNVDNDPTMNGEYWLVDSLAPDVKHVVDVGFNCGDFTRYVQQKHSGAHVFAFDPDPGAEQASHEFSGANFKFVAVALGDARGTAGWVSLGKGNPSNSLARPHRGHDEQRAPALNTSLGAVVPVETLDQWCEDHAIKDIDLLKIDAEGFDLNVLRGAQRMLTTNSIRVVMFEYGFGWLDANKLLFDAVSLLEACGYDIYRLFPNLLAPYQWDFRHENALSGPFVALLPRERKRFRVLELGFGF